MPPNPDTPKRPRGRPRSIDREAALDRAVEAFWAHGYEGASLDGLTAAMGLSRPSLYAAFGDKRALFLAAIERYQAGIGAEPMAAFEAEPDVRAAVRAFLRVSLENNTRPDAPAGCLVGCCAATSAPDLPGVRERLEAGLAGAQARVAARFERERGAGALPAGFPSAERAFLLLDLMQGQAFRARAGETREDLLRGLEARCEAVL